MKVGVEENTAGQGIGGQDVQKPRPMWHDREIAVPNVIGPLGRDDAGPSSH